MSFGKGCFTILLSFLFVIGRADGGSVPLSEEAMALKKGIYQHYKGNYYEVIGVSHHSETLEEFVNYRQLYGDYGYWVRPIHMFYENVLTGDNQSIPRFRYIGDVGNMDTESRSVVN